MFISPIYQCQGKGYVLKVQKWKMIFGKLSQISFTYFLKDLEEYIYTVYTQI
jgi:hypothetical protein